MPQVIDASPTEALALQALPPPSLLPYDAATALRAAAAGNWVIEHAVDPAGEESVIVLPAHDDPDLPTFLLYEEHGLARLAVIRGDIWESDQAFPSGSRAVTAILAATAAVAMAA
jgi:hypothetical protein